jgi:hypothetical protein
MSGNLPTWLFYEYSKNRLEEHFKHITPEITSVLFSIPRTTHINDSVIINFNKHGKFILHPDMSNCGLMHCHNFEFFNSTPYPIFDSIFRSFLSAFGKSAVMYTTSKRQVNHMKYFEKSLFWYCCDVVWRNRSSGNNIYTWIFTKNKVG